MDIKEGEYLPAGNYSSDERNLAMCCHLAVLGQLFFPPLIAAPFLIWWFRGEQMPLVRHQGKEVINLQITLFVAGLVAGALVPLLGLGLLLLGLVALYAGITGVVGAVSVREGRPYRYPINWRVLD